VVVTTTRNPPVVGAAQTTAKATETTSPSSTFTARGLVAPLTAQLSDSEKRWMTWLPAPTASNTAEPLGETEVARAPSRLRRNSGDWGSSPVVETVTRIRPSEAMSVDPPHPRRAAVERAGRSGRGARMADRNLGPVPETSSAALAPPPIPLIR
jgi:hypothetical protein